MKIGKFEKTNTSPLIKNRLLTLKGLSLSPTLFKVLLQKPPPLPRPPRPKRTFKPTQFEQELSSPPLCRRLQWDWVDRLRMQGGGRGRWTVSHTPRNVRKETQYGNLTNDQLYICCFIFYDFFFFHFVVSTMKLHALAGRSKKKKKVVVNGDVGCASWKDCHPNCTPPYPPGAWSHLTHNPHPSTRYHPSCSAMLTRVQTVTTAACLRVATLCHFVRSALSLFSFLIGQSLVTPCDGVTYMH